MRVVVAPDKFAGTLSAGAVARCFERGWRSVRPDDELDLVPVSDGGPGFVDCLGASLGGQLMPCTVRGPHGGPTPAHVLIVAGTAYVESAQANGLHLVPSDQREPLTATTVGVGELLWAAARAGATTLVVGLGGSATTDGGAGMLAALGATARRDDGSDATDLLRRGPAALDRVAAVDLAPARERVHGCRIVVATDVDSPLLGPTGASHGFARQKGADDAAVVLLEERLAHWQVLCEAAGAPPRLATAPGAGAAGGLGFGLLVLGGARVAGIETVLAAVELERRCATADLVVTGEGRFDWQSLRGKVVSGVVAAAGRTPVVVVAGQASVPDSQWRELGVSAVHSLAERAGSVDRAIAQAGEELRAVAADLARSFG